MTRQNILQFVLIFQGIYWDLSGLWAIVALDHFSRVTGLHPEPLNITDRFEIISISTLAIALALFFSLSSRKPKLLKPTALLLAGTPLL